MHAGHEHHHWNGGGGSPGVARAGIGHNRPSDAKRPLQWQTPHRRDRPAEKEEALPAETDLDLVEAAFVEGFQLASDPTSFLRLARVPFEGIGEDGAKLVLLRVEVECLADVGSITPHLGGETFRYDPLPARMVSRRKRLRLVYFDGQKPRLLGLAEAVSLSAA
ncbi:MAG TPA: hypothetical protein VKW08_12075 [Xanthobacteraceae bacterium]|jgi:hypothetical protein|nr:hypothetical protein [Xanthobacteraceae bacterium]